MTLDLRSASTCLAAGPEHHHARSPRGGCSTCAVRDRALCMGLSEPAAQAFNRVVHRRRMPAGRLVYAVNQPEKSFAIIISGVVKLINAKPDGRNQIVGLQFASEFTGRPFTPGTGLMAEAATDVELCSFSGRAFENLMETYPEIEHAVLKRTLDDLDSAREWMFMIGRRTAEERVAGLLIHLASKLSGNGPLPKSGPYEIRLPLSRTEIGEALGLRLETVSRQFAQLKSEGLIATGPRRSLVLKDIAELVRRTERSGD